MPRQRSPNRDKAFEIYKEHKGNIKLKDIAEKLHVSDTQIRKWKSSDKWEQKLKGTLPLKSNVTNKNKSTNKEPMHQEVEEVLNNSKLTEKQRLFCFYYSRCLNATKAYQKAYECSYIEAARNSYILRKNKDVNKLIDIYIDQEIDKERLRKSLVQKYIDIAFADMKEYTEFGRDYVYIKDSNKVEGTLISEISQGKDGVKIKLVDKRFAMDWLGKHVDLLTTEQQERFRIEEEKLKIVAFKVQGDPEEETTEDDGFIEALEGTAQEDWSDEEV